MRELRKDPILGRWVIVATERAQRPYDFEKAKRPSETPCAYCDEAEEESGVRVVPSVLPLAERHEVIVESRDHSRPLDAHSDEEVARMAEAWAGRLRAHAASPGCAAAVLFKNNAMTDRLGREYADHARSEIVSLPVIPKRVEEEMRELRARRDAAGTCLFCDTLEAERAAGERVVDENASFTAYCPFASHSPYEVMIVPRVHAAHFAESLGAVRLDFARILRSALGRIRRCLDNGPYYLVLHTAPFAAGERDYHWHVEVAPRTFFAAGFEWGGGVYINPVLPEDAARGLRAAGAP